MDSSAFHTAAGLQDALRRLAAAIDQLEAATSRRAAVDAARGDLVEELAVMQDDRARLAVDLDGALARGQALEAANHQVAQRLERASAALRAALGAVVGG